MCPGFHDSNIYLRCFNQLFTNSKLFKFIVSLYGPKLYSFCFISCCFVVIDIVWDTKAGAQGLVHARQASSLPLSLQAFAGGFYSCRLYWKSLSAFIFAKDTHAPHTATTKAEWEITKPRRLTWWYSCEDQFKGSITSSFGFAYVLICEIKTFFHLWSFEWHSPLPSTSIKYHMSLPLQKLTSRHPR